MSLQRTSVVLACGLALAGCHDSAGPTVTCNLGQAPQVVLPPGGFASFDAACLTFSGNASATDSAEYLVVAQSVGGTPGAKAAFELKSSVAAGTATTAQLVAPPSGPRS